MNKNYIVGVILLAVLFSYNQASAGLFDWVGSKSPTSLATNVVDGDNLPFDQIYNAVTDSGDKNADIGPATIQNSTLAATLKVTGTSAKKIVAKRTYEVSASAYSSTPDQTDDSPFITASNTYVRDGIVAANFLPFGTRIKIPKLFGNKIFVVEDRMNKRYTYNVDIWFADRQSAKQFGRKTVMIEVVSL